MCVFVCWFDALVLHAQWQVAAATTWKDKAHISKLESASGVWAVRRAARNSAMHSCRLPTGLGVLYIQHFSIFLGLRLCFMFASFCSHFVLVISTSWCRERQFPSLSRTCLLVICFPFTSNIFLPFSLVIGGGILRVFFFVPLWVPSSHIPIAGGSLQLLRRIGF